MGASLDWCVPSTILTPHSFVARYPTMPSGASGRHADGDVVLRHLCAPPGRVTCRHRVQRLVAAAVVVLVLEEDDRQRLLRFGLVEQDELCRRKSLRLLPFLHLALQR